MADFMKKQSIGSYFNCIAAVLGIVGIVAALICSKMTVTYALGNLEYAEYSLQYLQSAFQTSLATMTS